MAIKEIRYKDQTFALSYELLHPENQPTVLFLHGWGSHKNLMKQAFGKVLSEYKHIYLDLPGFGQSPNDHTVLTTHDYAAIARLFLEALGIAPEIIVGHSFGGKVATLLQPLCLVLVASAGVQVPKPLSVRAKIALTKLLKPVGGAWLRRLFASKDAAGMNEAMYATFKNVVNEDFEAHFDDVDGKALLFWGTNDTATPLWTAKRIQEHIGDAELFTFEGDHYFFLHHANAIATTIETHCKDQTA